MVETHSGLNFCGELQTIPADAVKSSEQPPECGLGEWLPKAWGRTRTIYLDHTIEIVECEIKAGGFSSEHLHRYKNNEFRVLCGLLKIEYQNVDSPRTLGTGDTMVVLAGTKHKFLALEVTRLIETYTPAGNRLIDAGDIERFSTGGLRE